MNVAAMSSTGFSGGSHELELGQSRAMILAVAQLHEATGDDVWKP